MSEQQFEKTGGYQPNTWKGGYQPVARNIKIDPKTGLPPLPKGGTAESGRRTDQSIRNESTKKN
jgi:hypothetical protein